METVSHLASSSSPPFLKLEDLHTPTSLADTTTMSINTTTPPPVIVHSKPAKKRKSWGQELPEPKTALPPRKRAKTDDEKEQRRIERIKRNRAAAHNSRERKRQETETLAVALARANAVIDAYRKQFGPLPASVVLPEVTLSIDDADTPAPSLVDSARGSIDAATSPSTPMDDEDDLFDCPTIKEEQTDSITFPPTFEPVEAKPLFPQLDPTQHSAVMLCDLQCRSTQRNSRRRRHPSSSSNTILNHILRSPSSLQTSTSWWASLFLYLMNCQLQTSYHTLILALWTISPSRVTRWMTRASTRRSTSPLTTLSMRRQQPLLASTPAVAQQSNAATGRVETQHPGASSSETRQRCMVAAAAAESLSHSHDSSLASQEHQAEDQNGQGS